ncbi:MAG: hypothetical protein ACXU8U_06185 [Asticcacaulis sp.]
MLSTRARAAAGRIKSLDEDDIHSLSEMIQHEVRHATDMLADRARAAEERLHDLAEHTAADARRLGGKAVRSVNDHPVSYGLAAVAIGAVFGIILMMGNRR